MYKQIYSLPVLLKFNVGNWKKYVSKGSFWELIIFKKSNKYCQLVLLLLNRCENVGWEVKQFAWECKMIRWETSYSNPSLCGAKACAFIYFTILPSRCLFWGLGNKELSGLSSPSSCSSAFQIPLYLPLVVAWTLLSCSVSLSEIWDPTSSAVSLAQECPRRNFSFWSGYLHFNAMLRNYPKDWLFPSGISGSLPGQWEVIWKHVLCRPMRNIAGRQMPVCNESLCAAHLHLTLLARISCCYSINQALHLSVSV